MSQLAQPHVSPPTAPKDIFCDAGLVIGTPVLTLEGELPVEYIAPGDRIITRSGMRQVLAVEVTRVENARVICINRDSLGVGRPMDEMMVVPNQPIMLRDWRAKALYGTAEALVPASRLCDGEFVRADILPEARFITLRFAAPEVIYAGGMELACAPATVVA